LEKEENKMAEKFEPVITTEIKEKMDEVAGISRNSGHRPGEWEWNGSLSRWEAKCECGETIYVFYSSDKKAFSLDLDEMKYPICSLS
jgi:hypothetical protein